MARARFNGRALDVVDTSSCSFVEVLVSSADMDLRLGVARVSELPSADDDIIETAVGGVGGDVGGAGGAPDEAGAQAGYTFDCAYIELRGCARLGLLLRGAQLSTLTLAPTLALGLDLNPTPGPNPNPNPNPYP